LKFEVQVKDRRTSTL